MRECEYNAKADVPVLGFAEDMEYKEPLAILRDPTTR
jgi:hypothetical protein